MNDSNVIWLNKDKLARLQDLNLPDEGVVAVKLSDIAPDYDNHPGAAKIKPICAEIDGDCA